MSERKRLHRGDSKRVGPIRDFSTLYHPTESSTGASPAKPKQTDAPGKARNGGPLAEGVELAYSVIEKYIAEGRQTAEGINKRSYANRVATDNLQSILERVLRFQAEILPLFVETLSTLVKVDPSRNGFGATDARPSSHGEQSTGSNTISVDVVSRRPVEVSVELKPNADVQPLMALGLNAIDPTKPPLTTIKFIPDNVPHRVKVRIEIADLQPPGVYSGVIVNRDSGQTLGTLTVRIAG